MPDRPYTDDDLRAEAAKQLATLASDAEFMCIGERMEGSPIDSTDGNCHWDQLEDADFDEAQRAIDGLIEKAADLSEWAIELGADGLKPVGDCLSLKGGDRPIVRVHFAFEPDMPEEMRTAFIEGVGSEIARYL